MRLINADRLLEILEREEAYHSDLPQRADGVRDAIMDVISAPTVDAVEVVRCRDCKWFEDANEDCGTCGFFDGARSANHYCGEGERKDGDGNDS